MGSDRDINFSYAERSLKKRYPSSEGWKIQRFPEAGADTPDFLITRKWRGSSQYALASVVLRPVISPEEIDRITPADRDDWGSFAGSTVLVARGADVSGLGDRADVLEMRGYVVEGSTVSWWKRPVVSEATEE
ncbi:MAG: hypothetical protein RQ758_02280 [Methanomicrobiaceae archaeon]|nr:hypothetical protein [Methanomicrobiaceae archaeon]